MKKLMIAAAAALVGVVASAASCDWSIDAKSFLMSDGSTKPDGQTIYILNATDADAFLAFTTAIEAGELGDNLAAVMSSEEWSALGPTASKTIEKGSMTDSKWNKNYAGASGKLDAAADNKKYTYAIFVADGENYLLSATSDGLSYSSSPDDGSPAVWGAADFGAWAKYESAGGDVPEPTSGLLLLLGMAGLALRRKQA